LSGNVLYALGGFFFFLFLLTLAWEVMANRDSKKNAPKMQTMIFNNEPVKEREKTPPKIDKEPASSVKADEDDPFKKLIKEGAKLPVDLETLEFSSSMPPNQTSDSNSNESAVSAQPEVSSLPKEPPSLQNTDSPPPAQAPVSFDDPWKSLMQESARGSGKPKEIPLEFETKPQTSKENSENA
jgi:hypothetical protein